MAEEVTYADLKFINPEQHKKKGSQKTITKASPSISHYWRPAAVSLGLFGLVLLGVTGTLGFKVLQASHRVSSQNENLTLQKEKLEILLTKLNVLQVQNRNLSETVQQLSNYRGNRCSPCPEKWLQRGENCYFFTMKWNSWEEGKAQCITLNSRLLKIENKEELEFILESAQSYNSYWIGLSRNRSGEPWLWEDNSTLTTDLFNIPDAGSSNYPICVSIQAIARLLSHILIYGHFCLIMKENLLPSKVAHSVVKQHIPLGSSS